MYYLGMRHEEIMRMDLAELNFYYEKLRKVKAIEADLEKLKIEATLAAASSGSLKRQFGGGGKPDTLEG
jgi:ABC-type phosphate transport system ATPase subunit